MFVTLGFILISTHRKLSSLCFLIVDSIRHLQILYPQPILNLSVSNTTAVALLTSRRARRKSVSDNIFGGVYGLQLWVRVWRVWFHGFASIHAIFSQLVRILSLLF